MTVCLKSLGNQQLRKAKIQTGHKNSNKCQKGKPETKQGKTREKKKMTACTQKERKEGGNVGSQIVE